MNFHHFLRFASYCCSRRLILISLIASAASAANAVQPVAPIAATTDIASCMVLSPDMWVDFTWTVAWALTGICSFGLFVSQALWFGFVEPFFTVRANASIMRSDKLLDAVLDSLRRRLREQSGSAEPDSVSDSQGVPKP